MAGTELVTRVLAELRVTNLTMEEAPDASVLAVLVFLTRIVRVVAPDFPDCAVAPSDPWRGEPDLSEVTTLALRDGARGFDLRVARLETRLATFNAHDEGHLWTVDVTAVGLGDGRRVAARAGSTGVLDLTVSGSAAEVCEIESAAAAHARTQDTWVAAIACCAAPEAQPEGRFPSVYAPTSERVLRCARCGVLWVEEWTSRAGFGGAEDRDLFRYLRISAAEAMRRFPPER